MTEPGVIDKAVRGGSAGLILAGFLMWVAGPPAHADVHEITVRRASFSPNDIVIQAGDTVTWNYSPTPTCGIYGCTNPPAHTVTADDFSWSSGPASDGFVYSRVFHEPGEVRYHCEVHSSPGLDIDENMNGRILVQATEPAFTINAGLNDAWYDTDMPGQGFFIIVFPDIGMMFVALFTFDVERPPPETPAYFGEPGHRWLTAFGPYEGNRAELEIEWTSGGIFDASQPEPVQQVDGTLTLEFAGCANGTVAYDIASIDVSGEFHIVRVVGDNVSLCESLAAAP